MPNKKRTLQIDEDIDFQRKEWRWQRAGIVLMFLVVIGALLGLTGIGGPLSRAEAADPSGAVHLEYERFVRRGARATITLHLGGSGGERRLWVTAPYFRNVVVESVAPIPRTVSVEQDRHVYTFDASGSIVTVILHVEHTSVGRIEGEVGLAGGPSVRFSQWSFF